LADFPKQEFSGVLCDGRWIGPHGIGRFASEVLSRLPGADILESGKTHFLTPFDPLWSSIQIAKRRPRVYFTPGFNPPAVSVCPFVMTIHDLIHLKISGEGGGFKRLYYEKFLKPALLRAFRVLTVSEFSRNELLEWSGLSPDRVIVTGNGVGPEFAPEGPRWDPGYPYFLYVGNHKPHKNLDMLLTAFSQARLPTPFRLVMTGTPDPVMIGRLGRLNHGNKVVFQGLIGEKNLPSVYRGAKALLFPSFYEGFGLPVLEAMSCGVPVIASRIPAVEEVAGDAAFLVHPEQIEDWKRGMEKVAEDREFQKTLGTRGRERAGLFSWEKTAEKVRQVIRSALNPSVQDRQKAMEPGLWTPQ